MIRSLVLATVVLAAAPAVAETCYQLSANGVAWSRTPELLCVAELDDHVHELTLKTGFGWSQRTVATFTVDKLQACRCIDRNEDVFGVANPSNSLLNDLAVRFSGRITAAGESGTVSIGGTTFHYRSL